MLAQDEAAKALSTSTSEAQHAALARGLAASQAQEAELCRQLLLLLQPPPPPPAAAAAPLAAALPPADVALAFATIGDLPDECLVQIFELLHKDRWVCRRCRALHSGPT